MHLNGRWMVALPMRKIRTLDPIKVCDDEKIDTKVDTKAPKSGYNRG